MPDPLVLRGLEPAQDEVLAHLAGNGLGRALAVLGDTVGSRLTMRAR